MDRFLTKTANKCQKSPIKSNFLSVFGGIDPSLQQKHRRRYNRSADSDSAKRNRKRCFPTATPPYNRSAASDSARRNRKRCFLTATPPI